MTMHKLRHFNSYYIIQCKPRYIKVYTFMYMFIQMNLDYLEHKLEVE